MDRDRLKTAWMKQNTMKSKEEPEASIHVGHGVKSTKSFAGISRYEII